MLNSRSLRKFSVRSIVAVILAVSTSCNGVTVREKNLQSPSMVDIDDFAELVKNDIFVDKSLFIEEYLQHASTVSRFTRPRGWGKSTNLDMLKRFLEIEIDPDGNELPESERANRKYFVGGEIEVTTAKHTSNRTKIVKKRKTLKPLAIAKRTAAMEHQGRYPVLLIDFKDIVGYNYLSMRKQLKKKISDLFKQHRYLRNKMDQYKREEFRLGFYGKFNDSLIGYSVRFLSDSLRNHFNRTICIMIADYDAPINRLFRTVYLEYRKEYPDIDETEVAAKVFYSNRFCKAFLLFWTFFDRLFKGNNALYRGLMVGVFDIKFANPLNRIRTDLAQGYSLHDKQFAEHFGFSATDVARMLTKVGDNSSSADSLARWYGYQLGETLVYNPLSIRRFLANGKVYSVYMREDANASMVEHLLMADNLQEMLQRLDNNRNPIVRNVSQSIDYGRLFEWAPSYLSFSGYFNFSEYGFGVRELSIPNSEVESLIRDRITRWLNNKLQVTTDDFRLMYDQLAALQVEPFKETLEKFLPSMPITEICCNAIMRCLTNAFRNDYLADIRVGTEKSNVTLVSKVNSGRANAILIDYKVIKRSKRVDTEVTLELDEMIGQRHDITNEKYPHVKQVLKIALVFCRKQLGLDFVIEYNDDRLFKTQRKIEPLIPKTVDYDMFSDNSSVEQQTESHFSIRSRAKFDWD